MTAPRTNDKGSRHRPIIMIVLACGLLLAMVASIADAFRRALPGTADPPAAPRTLRLAPGEAAWQTLYLPACPPRSLTLAFRAAVDAPGALHAAWFPIEGAARWAVAPQREMTMVLAPGETGVSIEVPGAAEVVGRLVGLRLTADRVAIALPVTREDLLPRGYVTRRPGYVSTDDLVLTGTYDDAPWHVAVGCVVQAHPVFRQKWLLIGALLVVAIAAGCLVGFLRPADRP